MLRPKNDRKVPHSILSQEASRWFTAKWVVNQKRGKYGPRRQVSGLGEGVFQTSGKKRSYQSTDLERSP